MILYKNHFDSLLITLISAPFSSFNLWFSVFRSSICWNNRWRIQFSGIQRKMSQFCDLKTRNPVKMRHDFKYLTSQNRLTILFRWLHLPSERKEMKVNFFFLKLLTDKVIPWNCVYLQVRDSIIWNDFEPHNMFKFSLSWGAVRKDTQN